ncbi:MlaD family protein [Sciscionella marina]|uniref:MlaD family protein n=1 Tax=Sciscionella marina TaxID=508770 RepID=UPI0003811130|nr:MlaD family protein [Sciscionella marina]
MKSAGSTRSAVVYGLAFFAVLVVAAIVVFAKPTLLTWASSGETITAEFDRDVGLQQGNSEVKIAGTKVGTVSGVDTSTPSKIVVSMKVDNGTRAKLGSAPTAAVRPVTLLGGRYYVQLAPGGAHGTFTGDNIALGHTTTPVDLDQVLSALQPPSRQGLRQTVSTLDGSLRNGGSTALQSLTRDAPGSLGPAAGTLDAMRGQHPDTDLPQLVTNLDSVATTLTRRSGQLGSVLDKLQGTAAGLRSGSSALGQTVAQLPATLRSTRAGITDLGATLDKLAVTAPKAQPAATTLNTTLSHLDPVLVKTRPLVADLRPLLTEARPLVDQLVPTSQLATGVLDDVRGPVLDRVNGPVISKLNEQWRGTGPFAGDGANGHTTFQELGYLAARFDNLSKYHDRNGPFANLQAGAGTNSIGGVPGLDRLLLDLTKIGGAPK